MNLETGTPDRFPYHFPNTKLGSLDLTSLFPMASSHLIQLCVFFLVLLFSSFQTEARVSKFFSKFIHTDNNVTEPTMSLPVVPSSAPVSAPPEIAPTLAPSPALVPSFEESQNAYGLYGRDFNDQFSTTEERPTITDVEEEILAEDTPDESSKSAYPKTSWHSNNYGNSGRYYQYQSNSDNNGYDENYRNNHYTDNYGGNGYETTERQGMSDTRSMENGKYFYDASERNGESYSFNGYGSRGDAEKGGNLYGNYKYPNEFDSMEEFENQEYQKSQNFIP